MHYLQNVINILQTSHTRKAGILDTLHSRKKLLIRVLQVKLPHAMTMYGGMVINLDAFLNFMVDHFHVPAVLKPKKKRSSIPTVSLQVQRHKMVVILRC